MAEDAGFYEQYIDNLQQFLITNLNTTAIGNGGAITWTIGDVGMADPSVLPAGFLIPYFDTVEPYSNGLDKDTYVVPLLVVEDLHKYGPAVPNVNVSGGFEQPGHRVLTQYGDAIRTILRAGGAGITLGGQVSTSVVSGIRHVWVRIAEKPYRGVRLVVQATQRVPRTTL